MFMMTNSVDDKHKNHTAAVRTWAPKILSVVAAVFLWFYVSDIQNTTVEKTIYNIPVIIENGDSLDPLTITTGKDYMVDLTFKGNKDNIQRLTNEEIVAYIDVRGIDSIGSHERSVNVRFPENVQLVRKSISAVKVSVDQPLTVTLDVQFEAGQFEIDSSVYEMLDPFVHDDYVTVSGPKSVIETLAFAKATTDLGVIEREKEYKIPLTLINKDGEAVTSKNVTITPSFATVTVPVNKTVAVPIRVNFDYDTKSLVKFEYDLKYDSVLITGDATLVDTIDRIETLPVTEKGVQNGIPVALKLPSGIQAKNPDKTFLRDGDVTLMDITAYEEFKPEIIEPVIPDVIDGSDSSDGKSDDTEGLSLTQNSLDEDKSEND